MRKFRDDLREQNNITALSSLEQVREWHIYSINSIYGIWLNADKLLYIVLYWYGI